jgi:DNA primase
MQEVVRVCQELLHSHPRAQAAREYLNDRLSHEAQINFQFGYFPTQGELGLLTDCVPENSLIKLGLLFYYFNYDHEEGFPSSQFENNNLVMPYNDLYGKPIALAGRTLLLEEERQARNIPKYRNSSFSKGHHLFGLDKARDTIIQENTAIIVEGQFDCIKAHSVGIKNVVALGSSNMSFEQFCLIMRYCENLIILLDNDEAGIEGSKRILSSYGGRGTNIRNACVPENYKDLFDYLNSETISSKEFTKMIKNR